MTSEDRTSGAMRSAERVAFGFVENTVDELEQLRRAMARDGMLRSGNTIARGEEVLRQNFSDAAHAASARIGEIFGAAAPPHADGLEAILTRLAERLSQDFQDHLSQVAPTLDLIASRSVLLRAQLAKEIAAVVEDLRVGIAGGVNVSKSRGGDVNVSVHGVANVQAHSPGAQQVVLGDQHASSWDPAPLLAELQAIRRAVEIASSAKAEARNEVLDELLALEREATAEKPDVGRLRRIWGKLIPRLEALGIGVASSVVTNLLPALPI